MKNRFLLSALILGSLAANAAVVKVTVKNSTGALVPNASVQLVTSQYGAAVLTDANGYAELNAPNGTNCGVKVSFNHTYFQSPHQVLQGNRCENFQTSKLTVKTTSCGTPVEGQGISYLDGSNSWRSLGASDATGKASIELFPMSNLKARVTTNGGSISTIPAPATWVLGVSGVCMEFNNLIKLAAPGTSWLVGSSWVAGQAASPRYVFPGVYHLKVNGTEEDIELPEGTCTFDKTAVVIKVVDHNNNPIQGAYVRGGNTNISWHVGPGNAPTPTGANGILIDWKPANAARIYECRVNNTLSTQTKNTAVNGGQLFIFKTSELQVKVLDCEGNGVAGAKGRYGFGAGITNHINNSTATDASGIHAFEAFPGTFIIEENLNSTKVTVPAFVFNGTNSLVLNTTRVTNNYGAGKIALGSTYLNGTMNVFPGPWSVRFQTAGGYAYHTITFEGCDKELNSVPAPAAKFSTDVAAVAGTSKFNFFPNPVSNNVMFVEMPTKGHIAIFNTTGVRVIDQSFETGRHQINMSNLPTGNYFLRVDGEGEMETYKLIKQ